MQTQLRQQILIKPIWLEQMRLTRRGMKEPPSSHNQSKDHQTLTLNHIPLLMGLWRKKLSPRWKMLTIDCYDGLLDLDEHVD